MRWDQTIVVNRGDRQQERPGWQLQGAGRIAVFHRLLVHDVEHDADGARSGDHLVEVVVDYFLFEGVDLRRRGLAPTRDRLGQLLDVSLRPTDRKTRAPCAASSL